MQLYRIKHKKTGLYYKPRGNSYNGTNLSTKGKIYASSINPLTSDENYKHITIQICSNNKIFKQVKDVVKNLNLYSDHGYYKIYTAKIPKEEFEIEYINTNNL